MRKLLVADDSKTLCEIYRLIFEDEGYNVISAYNGREALALISQEDPKVVILDINMPEVDGYGVLDGLGDYVGGVLVVSANNIKEGEFSAYRQVKGVYKKPVNRDQLILAVRQLMDRDETGIR